VSPTRQCGLWFRAAAGFGCFLLTEAAGLPGLGSREARVTIDVKAMPWAAVARVQVPGLSRCTGVLIGPRTVVTAAHCLYGRTLGHFAPPSSIHVLLGYADGGFARHAVAASIHVADGYNPGVSGAQGTDVAVIALATSMAGPGGFLTLMDGPLARETPLMLGGYGQDRAERIFADVSCKALGYAYGTDGRIVLVHNCAGTRGTSGGPALALTSDGSWAVAGVQVAGNADAGGGSAVPAAAIHPLLPPN